MKIWCHPQNRKCIIYWLSSDKKDRATAKANTYRRVHVVWTCGSWDMWADSTHSHKQTYRCADRNTSRPSWRHSNNNKWSKSFDKKAALLPYMDGSMAFARWRQRASLGPPESRYKTTLLIGSAVFAGFTIVTDRQTDGQTDHASQSVIKGRIYIVLRCGLIVTIIPMPMFIRCCYRGTEIAIVHAVHLMNADSTPALRSNQPIWAVSPPVGCYRPRPPSPFIIITQPQCWHSYIMS